METFLNYLIPIALAAVAIVLVLGLWNMMRSGSSNLSQTLMRWRVILQALAILIIVAVLLIAPN